ncbi:hypothetical protein OROHE_002609 [Orobanche hederae]
MHADEDELIGFKKCEGSDSDEYYEPDEVDETVDGNDTTVEEEGGMNEGELSDGAMGDYLSGDDDLQEEGTFIGDEFEENQGGEEGDFAVGQVFGSIEELRVKMKDYVMRRGITMVQDRNEPKRYTVHCAAKKKGCPWRIHASVIDDTTAMMVKTYEAKHRCVRKVNERMADQNWLSAKFVEYLKDHPNSSAKKLNVWVNKRLKVVVPYMRGREAERQRGREKAMLLLGGDHEEGFKLRPPIFKRLFCGLDGLKKGFLGGCSPFLFFDGCHLKGKYGGVMLSVVGTDANCGIYPLAWAIVESENKESWVFFLHCLEQFVGREQSEKRKAGRPRMGRVRHPSEGGWKRKHNVELHKQRRTPACSLCGSAGHNKLKCPKKLDLSDANVPNDQEPTSASKKKKSKEAAVSD